MFPGFPAWYPGHKNTACWRLLWVPEGLGSSGRLVGIIFTSPGTAPTPRCWVVAQNHWGMPCFPIRSVAQRGSCRGPLWTPIQPWRGEKVDLLSSELSKQYASMEIVDNTFILDSKTSRLTNQGLLLELRVLIGIGRWRIHRRNILSNYQLVIPTPKEVMTNKLIILMTNKATTSSMRA